MISGDGTCVVGRAVTQPINCRSTGDQLLSMKWFHRNDAESVCTCQVEASLAATLSSTTVVTFCTQFIKNSQASQEKVKYSITDIDCTPTKQ